MRILPLLALCACATQQPPAFRSLPVPPPAELPTYPVYGDEDNDGNEEPWVDPTRVGVLLPLSGRYQQYGERALAAMRIATEGTHIELVVRDTAGDAKTAYQALEELAARKHVVAVLGPISWKASAAAAAEAERSQVPMLSLSHYAGIADVGPWVFRTALTAEAQAKALARVAFRDLQLHRFALLFPRTRYGTTFANAFWDEVDRRRGEIRGVESYDVSETTFTEQVQKLVGLHYYRGALLNTELVIDFDAVVIPASPLRLGMIAPALAMEDVVTTRNRRKIERIRRALGVREVHPVRLLGGSTWNSPQTLEHCVGDCEWAVFVDAFWPDNPEVRVRDFVAAFREERGTDPALLDAIAFDTATLVVQMLRAGAKSRAELRQRLTEVTAFDGLTGTLSFSPLGEVNRELQVLTVKNGAIRTWRPD